MRSLQTQLPLSRYCGISLVFSLPPVSTQSSDVSTFPIRQPHRYSSTRPLPSLKSTEEKKEEGTHETHFTICHQNHRAGRRENHTNQSEIDFICSCSLTGTPCHSLFWRQEWGSIAESDSAQREVYSRADVQDFRTKLCRLVRWKIQLSWGIVLTGPEGGETQNLSFTHTCNDFWTSKSQKRKQVSWNVLL